MVGAPALEPETGRPLCALVSTGRRDTWIGDFVDVCLTLHMIMAERSDELLAASQG
jgi:hypothetical protein